MKFLFLHIFFFIAVASFAQSPRVVIPLNDNWRTVLQNNDSVGRVISAHRDGKTVNIPHNWDSYEGYRRLLHGNRHGSAWYSKLFTVARQKPNKRFFLFFEGVGSYASVFVNGKRVGSHAGGRTTFTLDITDVIKPGMENELIVLASHPSGISDLPWVCGGCSDERGFSEGSQPFGIFRPVYLVITEDARIVPFGVHAYASIKDGTASLTINTTVQNYSGKDRNLFVHTQLQDEKGRVVMEDMTGQYFVGNDSLTILQGKHLIKNVQLWSPDHPYLYKIVSYVKENNRIIDKIETPFGFRTINWKNSTNQFFINGKPVFINGVAEYEHLLGQSHAFSREQIYSRMKWVKAAGFNGFRDGHQPHNLLYGNLCDTLGILWWTQLSAHIWYDTPGFRNNFKQLLKEWVIERRNNPSVVLWGLQNESKLPEDFAKECTELIRSLDPGASAERLVTTCNGGSGTDWDVPQNWTGTYGGNPNTYAEDVKKQVLIGEYGAWRTIDLHTEGPFVQNGVLSEDRMTLLMEQKIRLAESVKDSSAGQFFWLLTSHDNPGRVQGGEGLRELDRIGPVNYKGLLTPWEEPLDVFYMFRSNYAPKETSPMVYIVSHTWPGRWTTTGIKDSIVVYSNCDEVELFNDVNAVSLGKRKRNGIGTHFQWDKVNIQYNVLYATGYVNGKIAARDTIVLHHLPKAPGFDKLYTNLKPVLKPAAGYNYIYRVNCGGPRYKDENGNYWEADKPLNSSIQHQKPKWGSVSWTNDFDNIPDLFASQRRVFDPIKGSKDWKLFQDFRYGKDKLVYHFPLPDGEYLVELYFIEPWLGTGGGIHAEGMRLFDVAINDKTVLKNIDLWKEAGTRAAVKKTVKAAISGGMMKISFPSSKSGQAVISAIAIASLNKNIKPAASSSIIDMFLSDGTFWASEWLDIGDSFERYSSAKVRSLPPMLYGADYLVFTQPGVQGYMAFTLNDTADVYIGVPQNKFIPSWMEGYENTKTEIETDENGGRKYTVYRKRFAKGSQVNIGGAKQHSFRYKPEYPVIIIKANNMQPAYDLKAVTPYRTNVAVVSPGVQKENTNGRECTVIKSNERVTIEWPVQTGVADIYAITVKYYYPAEKIVKGKMQLIGPGGTMMLEEPVSFTFTRPGKWNQFTFNTGSMVNAGNYTVRLVTEQGEQLAISGIEIQ